MTYEAVADLQRMRDDEAYEEAWQWDCFIKMLHFGIVNYEYKGVNRGFPNYREHCPAQEADGEMCYECPDTETMYKWCCTSLEKTPKLVERSLNIVRLQMKRSLDKEAQGMYEDYLKMQGEWFCPECGESVGWTESCDADSIETSYNAKREKIHQEINWGYVREIRCDANGCELEPKDLW
jgi:hypothetical protein